MNHLSTSQEEEEEEEANHDGISLRGGGRSRNC